jgi:hypothetical protein
MNDEKTIDFNKKDIKADYYLVKIDLPTYEIISNFLDEHNFEYKRVNGATGELYVTYCEQRDF